MLLQRIWRGGRTLAGLRLVVTIAVVAATAGVGSWLAFLVATIGMMFVAGSIGTLAKRHPLAGSYFVYIGRNFGPVAGALGGWAMILAYITTAAAVIFGFGCAGRMRFS